MSWGASLDIAPGEGITITNLSNVDSDEHRLQFETAKSAVSSVLNTGALGGPTKRYKVTLSGHGNPNHEPTAGWSNDSLTISIYQVSEDTP